MDLFQRIQRSIAPDDKLIQAKPKTALGQDSRLISTVKIFWEGKGIISKFNEMLVSIAGIEQNCGCQENMWTLY